MQKIIPHLWFDKEAEAAAKFYVDAFGGESKIAGITRYTEAGHEIHKMEAGSVMTVDFEVAGYRMIALNGGPVFTITPALSFMVVCPSADSVDALWKKLADGGRELMPLDSYPFSPRYGWVQDKYGATWQIIFSEEATEQHIVPSIMFVGEHVGKAEEAIEFYTSVFPDSKKGRIAHYGTDHAPDKPGTVMYADFTIANQLFAVMDNAYPHKFTLNEAVSLMIECDSQEEIDAFWKKLSAVPESEQCGWIKDKYGVSWQVVPKGMGEMLDDPDKEKAARAMNAVMGMKKLDIAAIRRAYEEK